MIFGIYLAAGQSKRMGCPKLALPLGNKQLGSIALETAIGSNLDKIIVVTNQADSLSWLPNHLSLTKCVLVQCEQSSKGQAESLKCGLTTAIKRHAEAVMILLADQPFVTKEIINHIVTLYKKEKNSYIAASYNGIISPPVMFDSTLFPALFKLQGDIGAREIIRNNSQGLIVKFSDKRHFLDVDTVKQYKSLLNDTSFIHKIK
ncbi:NTP transferase domain-containing protein [Anaerobacillus sp. MEB173]|uniref:NTP transferase domain-containing protein n=1 Tax=Anaerobacillus sp. MEB173 TaxID=3383345 RepID=UPI003F910701